MPPEAAESLPSRQIDVEADWILMTTCNYRCGYCFWTPEQLSRHVAPPAPIERLAAFFDATNLTWMLHLTGGEPFAYPRFVELCELLTRHHWISINSNLDLTARVARFSEIVSPDRVPYVNAGLHYPERQTRGRVDQFLANVRLLRMGGFTVFATAVMHPDLFAVFPEVWEYCQARDVALIPKAFQGEIEGAVYPKAYTEAQRALFRSYADRARERYGELFNQVLDAPTVNPTIDAERFLDGLPDYRGAECFAGDRFVRIREDGEIRRCGPGDVLGNVVTGEFRRRSGTTTCRELECPYFCEKYVVRPEDGAAARRAAT